MRTNADLVAAYAEKEKPAPEAPPVEASTPVEVPAPVAPPDETPQPSADDLVAAARRDERAQAERAYKGLQRTLAQREAENAQLRAQAEQLRYLPGMAQVLSTLAQNQLGPEAARQLGYEVENAQLKAALQAASQPQPQPEAVAYQAPAEQREPTKADVLQAWFPSQKSLNADDPRIVWGDPGDNPATRQQRFRDSVVAAIADDAANAARTVAQEKIDKANAAMREAGVDNSDGALPAGAAGARANAIGLSQDPKTWKPRDMMRSWFDENNPQTTRDARKGARVTI
jgi:hypothetical protein